MPCCKPARAKFREPIVIQDEVRTQDATTKEWQYSWNTVIETRAEVLDAGGLRFIRSDRLEPETTHIMRLRDNSGINRDQRVWWNSKEFKINRLVRVPSKDFRGEILELHAEEIDVRT